MLKRPQATDAGFSVVEMLISIGIILIVMTGFATFLMSIGSTQRSMALERAGMRALTQEVDLANAIRWDNLMLTPQGTPSSCILDNKRISTEAINAGPEIVRTPSISVSVTRSVQWMSDNGNVICESGAKDRPEAKKVTITVTWIDGTKKITRSATIVRSRYAENW